MTDNGEGAPPWAEMAGPPASGVIDRGPDVLDMFQDDLQMDAEWLVREERTLSWFGESTPLVVSVARPRLVQGDPTVKVTARVTIVSDVQAPTEQVLDLVDEVNHLTSTGAYVWIEDERRVDAFLANYHWDGLEPITHTMIAFALLAYTEAVGRAEDLADQLDGTIASAEHPKSGHRDGYDELITFTESTVIPAGAEDNRWLRFDFDGLVDALTESGVATGASGQDGMSLEFPIPQFESEPGQFGIPTALLQLLCQDHPLYGAGLVSLLRVPLQMDAEVSAVANALNLAELQSRTGFPSLGAWCTDSDGSLAHNAFIPSLMENGWLPQNLALWARSRMHWALQQV